jgi:hypothetical protein
MFRIARNVLGLLAAILLMVALGAMALILGVSNPSIHVGFFLAPAGICFTLIVLLFLNKE